MKNLSNLLITASILFCLIVSQGKACQFDTDCYVGSQCLKQWPQIYGVCVGGMNPGNSNDLMPSQPLPGTDARGMRFSGLISWMPGFKCEHAKEIEVTFKTLESAKKKLNAAMKKVMEEIV